VHAAPNADRERASNGTASTSALAGLLGCLHLRFGLLLVSLFLVAKREWINAGITGGPLVAFGLVSRLLRGILPVSREHVHVHRRRKRLALCIRRERRKNCNQKCRQVLHS
jgi:hypothetical protein